MSASLSPAFKDRLLNHPGYQFWLWQAGFWVLLSIISFFTLTLWYEQLRWAYINHTMLQAMLGFLHSLPLCWLIMRLWNRSIWVRLLISLMAVFAVALSWTIMRLEAFVRLTQEQDVWADFGGWFFGSIFIYIGWVGMFYGLRYYQLLQSEHNDMLKAEAEAKGEQLKRIIAQSKARDAQIKMLRYQLNPHFLCNTLNVINALVEAGETDKAQKMTVNLSRFLRYSLDNNPDTKVALENEVTALNLYLDIEKTRFGDRLKLNYQIDDVAKRAKVPSLLLQPIIENSMKHAIAKSEDGGSIGIKATVTDGQLVLELSDSGAGVKIAKSKLHSSTGRGVGLRNTDQRLEALYGKNYVFELSIQASGGLRTTIKLPYEHEITSAQHSADSHTVMSQTNA